MTTTITCDCKIHQGKSANVRGDGTHDGKPYTKTMVHNLVALAHSPLAKAQSVQRFGPWPVD